MFVIEKYVEDVEQPEKDVPNLVEVIIRLTDPEKKESYEGIRTKRSNFVSIDLN